MPTDPGPLVAVVGGGLAGMAAAARLAKMGHAVRLHEATGRLGGRWAPYALDVPGAPGSTVLVDDAPGVLTFPAPWRDLFRKSGRPLEAELARTGHALVPAPPTTYAFADGSTLVLPSDRGAQHTALLAAYGPGAAARWQHLLDGLVDVWQALRPLGLEEAYDRGALTRDVVRRLRPRRRLADLADALDEPHLRAVVRSTAYREGTTPERAPALAAVGLLVERTFGRWQVAPDPAARTARTTDVGRSSVLVEALAARLALRGVDVRLGSRVEAVETGPDGARGVRTADAGVEPAAAVVLAVDPWTAAALAPATAGRPLRRALRQAGPALLPVAAHAVTAAAPTGEEATADLVREHLDLDAEGRPLVTTTRLLGGRVVRTTWDHRSPAARPGSGVATDGFRGWRRRPGTTTAVPGLVLAGAASPAGPSPSAVLQTGALATYAAAGRRD
ncbi:FAD-dependent oxidoreductase [Microlunatus flavus]|uniref:UDP-galactopyranose mutase n=1 Tax=Microlunatus flavus TaxID=1036181 RepID=A0A1H9HH33_9ACTN|nr:FAD-dependent oxidoreductase [Microlunatus flavus]SEQ61572.1 UDP-galactopyranose mutase [Microlunatus flavus]